MKKCGSGLAFHARVCYHALRRFSCKTKTIKRKKQFSKAMKTMKALAAVVLLGGVALGQMPGAATPRVQVEKAVKGQDRIIRRSVGATEAIDSVTIHSAVEGYLQEVNFKEGRLVHKGDVLMRIDPLRYEAAVQQAEAAITELEERMVYAQNRVNRLSSLASNQAASQEVYESAVAALATCKAKKVAAEAELVRAKKNLDDCTIRAEVTGRIGRLLVSPGNYITPAEELAVINQIDPIYVRFPLSQYDVNAIFRGPNEIGKLADVRILTAAGLQYGSAGQVKIVDNLLSGGSDTYTLWAEFPNAEQELVPSGISSVYVKLRETAETVMVPLTSVHHDSTGSYVYTVDDQNTVSRKEVIAGTVQGRYQAIYDGIQEGETVVTDGSHKTRVGGTVIPVFPDEKVERTTTQSGQEADKPVEVETAEVKLMEDPSELTVAGAQVEAINTVLITAQVQGLLQEMPFKEGQKVHKGDVLFRIDPTHYQAAVDVRKAAIAQLDVSIRDAKQKYERQQFLVKSSASSKDELESARATLGEAEAMKRAAEAALRVAEDDLARCTICAPMDGVIGRAKISEGAYISSRTPLAIVVQTNPVYVRFPLSETALMSAFGNAGRLMKEADITLVTATGQAYKEAGKIAFCDNHLQEKTDTQNIWAEFPNEDGKLIPGGVVTLKIRRNPQFKVAAVPAQALLTDTRGKYVYVMEDGHARRVNVIIGGSTDDGFTAVTHGLEPGMTVITTNLADLEDGCAVSPANAQ